MFDPEYLTLRLVRLKPPDQWTHSGAGLSFIFPKGGIGSYASGAITRPLAAGEVLVLNGPSAGKLSVTDRGDMVFWWASVCLEHLFPLLAGQEICLLQNVADDLRNARLYPASTPLARECHKLLEEVPPQADLGHRGQVLRLAAAILSEEFKAAHGRRTGYIRPEEHILQVFEKLSVTEILDRSVAELAAKFGCSRRHLNRLFHQHFGFSVAALRMEMRLLKAVSLLRDPDAKVINVAEQCGFNHLGLFNTCFRRRFGASPGQYRKLNVPPATSPAAPFAADPACPLHVNGLCPWTGGPGSLHPLPPQLSGGAKAAPAKPPVKTRASDEHVEPKAGGIHQKPAADADRRSAAQSSAVAVAAQKKTTDGRR